MKFLDDEWYEIHLKKIGETFTEPGKLNTSLVEVYRNTWGKAGNTKWIKYVVEKTMVKEIMRGEGEDSVPDAAFRCSVIRKMMYRQKFLLHCSFFRSL